MKRVGKREGEEAEKVENIGEKLRRGLLVGKSSTSRGPSTPVALSSWRLCANTIIHHHLDPPLPLPLPLPHPTTTVSARKLAAALWEFHHYFPLFKMHRNGGGGVGGGDDHRLRRHHYSLHKDKAPDVSNFLPDNTSTTSPDHPASASSLRRQIAASLMQHHRVMERNRNNHALQPVSPASYGSSMEMTPYNPAATPSSSVEFKGRIGESRYSLKTSTELLKVLNRIWSLEEQHASNISMIKALKTELDHARLRVKELLRDRQADRNEIDGLMKKIAEEKLVRKSKEQERLHAAVQSVRDELEDERKLRKRSESIHRKLARELSEIKSSFTNALKELEQERTRRTLLEDLCDEFARGINEYEQEVHALKQKPDKDWERTADHDRLILHISESWLDERMQMQLEAAQIGFTDKKSIVDKLSLEIETFLKAKQNSRISENLVVRDRRSSLESVPLNDIVSAPQDVGDDDSGGSDSNCFELNKPSNRGSKEEPMVADNNFDGTLKSKPVKKKPIAQEGLKNRSPSNLQVQFEEQMAWGMSSNSNKNKSQSIDAEEGKTTDARPVEGIISEICEHSEITENVGFDRKNNPSELHSSNKNSHVIDSVIIGQLLASESGNMHGEASCSNAGWRKQASPVRQWMPSLTPQDRDNSEPSKVPPSASKENTLRAKLLEARSKGQRSRLKALKGSF